MCISLGGLVVGVVAALALGRLVRPTLFGVTARDPMIFASVGALLLVVALVAVFIPTQKAMQLDPIEAVRHE